MSATQTNGRLPWPTRDELDADAAAVYDHIVGSRRASAPSALTDAEGRLLGPFNAMLACPAVGDALQRLGAAIRYRSSLPDRVRELAILTVAAYRHSAFEWHSHAPLARGAGLSDADVACVRDGLGGGLGDADQLVRRGVESLLDDQDLGDAAFEALRSVLGLAGVVELVTLVGYYDLLARNMRTFRVPLPEGWDPEVLGSTTGAGGRC